MPNHFRAATTRAGGFVGRTTHKPRARIRGHFQRAQTRYRNFRKHSQNNITQTMRIKIFRRALPFRGVFLINHSEAIQFIPGG